MLANMLSEILDHIGNDDMAACEAQEQLLNSIITDGNYLYYNDYLAHNYRKRAAIYTSNEEYEKAAELMKRINKILEAKDKGNQQ